MEQIKHKLGDLVYVVCERENCCYISYGAIVGIHHKMEDNYRTYLKNIQEYGEYNLDTLGYDVVTCYDDTIHALSQEVFDTIQDALDCIRRTMKFKKVSFEIFSNVEDASDKE